MDYQMEKRGPATRAQRRDDGQAKSNLAVNIITPERREGL